MFGYDDNYVFDAYNLEQLCNDEDIDEFIITSKEYTSIEIIKYKNHKNLTIIELACKGLHVKIIKFLVETYEDVINENNVVNCVYLLMINYHNIMDFYDRVITSYFKIIDKSYRLCLDKDELDDYTENHEFSYHKKRMDEDEIQYNKRMNGDYSPYEEPDEDEEDDELKERRCKQLEIFEDDLDYDFLFVYPCPSCPHFDKFYFEEILFKIINGTFLYDIPIFTEITNIIDKYTKDFDYLIETNIVDILYDDNEEIDYKIRFLMFYMYRFSNICERKCGNSISKNNDMVPINDLYQKTKGYKYIKIIKYH